MGCTAMNVQQMALAVVAGKWDLGTAAGPPGFTLPGDGLGWLLCGSAPEKLPSSLGMNAPGWSSGVAAGRGCSAGLRAWFDWPASSSSPGFYWFLMNDAHEQITVSALGLVPADCEALDKAALLKYWQNNFLWIEWDTRNL